MSSNRLSCAPVSVLAALASRFLLLDRLPLARAAVSAAIREHMRMTPDHFFGDGLGHVGEGEQAGLFRDARVIDHLEEEIAEFVLQVRHVRALDRVGDFVGLFDRVGRNGRESLHAVPWAAALGIAKRAHHAEKPLDLVAGSPLCVRLIA